MIIIHDFGIELEEYDKRGLNNEFPVLNYCPNCNCISYKNLHRNGFYWRYGINSDYESLIPICRFRCLGCSVNISILPAFLIPYFQHTLNTIMMKVHYFLMGKKTSGTRQHLAQLVLRYKEGLAWIHSFFVDVGQRLNFTTDIKKEALKYMKMIHDTDISSFYRKSWGHLSHYFMGSINSNIVIKKM